jgi:CBS domain containing-hemolysin-like protein
MTVDQPPRNIETARSGSRKRVLAVLVLLAVGVPATARASIFEGETLDKVAEILAWVVLVIAPVVGITVFWLVHILPEKIAEKKHHPQAKAIQVLCLLSLAFGGLLWPLAWLWAYSKPVLYKMAYGTDVHEEPGSGEATTPPGPAAGSGPSEIDRLRARVAELEAKLVTRPAGSGA